jgi:hypothetical protein
MLVPAAFPVTAGGDVLAGDPDFPAEFRPEMMVPLEQAMTGVVLSTGLLPTHPAGTGKHVLPPPGPNPSQI